MPTAATNTYPINELAPAGDVERAMQSVRNVALTATQTLAAGTVMGKVTATGAWKAYASGSVDGSQKAAGILKKASTVDGSGNITNWSEWGIVDTAAPIFFAGQFLISDLTGLDDNAVTVLNAEVDGNGVANATFLYF